MWDARVHKGYELILGFLLIIEYGLRYIDYLDQSVKFAIGEILFPFYLEVFFIVFYLIIKFINRIKFHWVNFILN